MYNKKVLSKATAELDKAKAPKKPKDIITDPMGQWKYPGEVTRIPSNNITMKGVNYPVVGVANTGQRQIMLPGADYTFPGANYVDEYPQMRKGGSKKTKSISGTNKLMDVHPFFKNHKHKRFDPKVKHFQEGGAKTLATNKSKDGTITNKVRRDGKTFLQVKTKDGKYYEKEIPTVTKAKGIEAVISKSIGNPMDRAYDYVEKLRSNGEDPQDNLRHATAGRYAAEGLLKNAREGYIPFPDAINKATSWLGANALGVGHELTTIFQDERPWGTKLREAAEDIYNNGVGVNQGLSDKSSKAKTQNLKNRSLNYELPDGYGEEHPFHNKWVDPYSKKQDGGYIEAELTDDEIEEYRKGGFIVEDISVPELNQVQKGGAKDKFATHIGDDGTVGTTNVHTDKNGTITTKVQDSKGITHYKVKTKDGKVFYKQDASTAYPELTPEQKVAHQATIDKYQREHGPGSLEWERKSSGAAQPVDDFWTLPIGMTSAGVKGAGALVKGTVAAVKGVGKSSLAQATKAGTKALFNTAPSWAPGMTLGNAIGAGFAGNGLTNIVTGKVAEPWKKANKSGKGSDYVDAINENLFTALDIIPLYGAVGKTAKQFANYAKAAPIGKATTTLNKAKHVDNKLEEIRRVYHNAERFLKPEESALLTKYGRGERLDYFNPVLRKKTDVLINKYINNPRFNPYQDENFYRHVSNAHMDISRRSVNGKNITKADKKLLKAMENRSNKTANLYNMYGHAQLNDPSMWQTVVNKNPTLRKLLQNDDLFRSPEFNSLPDAYRNRVIDFRNNHLQSTRGMFNRGSIDLRRNVSHAQNSYTEPQQAFEDAIKELHNTEKGNKHAKKIEAITSKLVSNPIVPEAIPYHQVDKIRQHTIHDLSLLSKNNIKEMDEKIDFISKALKNPKLKNQKIIKSLETQLEDLHSNKWLRTGYHETMKEAGFKIPDAYKDMSIVTQGNIKYLFDSKGNLLGNISGVSKEHPFIGSTGLMPHLHGTHEAGKQSQMAKTLYRSVHHGLNKAHGVPLQTHGNFAYTELMENGKLVRRKRASHMWDSGVAKGWFESTGPGKYKVIKQSGGMVTQLTPKEIQEYINQGYIVEEH